MELFKILGKVAIDGSGAIKEIDTIATKSKTLADTFMLAGEKISGFGSKLTKTVTAAGVAIGGLAVNGAIKFQDAMANINTLLDDDKHLKGYEGAIKNFSNQTGIALDIVSDGMYQTISSIGDNGAATEKMFEIMGKSAKAGGADVSDSVALISAGMKGYNQVNEETAQKISDLGFQTAKLGVTTFPELARSMQPLFPLSSGLGISYEELFGVMATGTGVTGNTAEVTTQFKAVLSNLMSPTKNMTELIAKYGYSNAQAMLESEGLSGVLKIVQTETGGQADKMAELFSSTEAVTLMTALTGAQFDNFTYKLGEMQSATGATDTAYEKMNTTGDKIRITWNQLKNTLVDLGETLLTTFGPTIENVAKKIQEVCKWFSSLDEGTKSTILKIGGLIVAAGPLLIAIGKVSSAIGSIIGIGGKLVGGIGGIVAKISGVLLPAVASIGLPVAGVVAIIAGLIAVGVLLYKNWDEIKAFASSCWEGIKNSVSVAIEGIKGFFGGIIDFISNNWQGLALLLVNPFVGGFKLLYDNCETFRTFIDGFINTLKDTWSNMSASVSESISTLKENVTTKISELKDNVVSTFENLREKAVEAWNGMAEKVSGKIEELRVKATEKTDQLKQEFESKWEEVKLKTTQKVEEMKEKTIQIVGEIKNKAVQSVEEMKQGASEKYEEMKNRTSDALKSLASVSKEKWNSIKTGTIDILKNISESISVNFKGAEENILKTFTKIKDGIKEKIEWARDVVENAIDKIKSFLKFDWEFPKIKMPHFEMSGRFSLDPPSVPKLGVEWYAKGGVMTKPTAFGINPYSGNTMIGGEAGPEAIAPITVLQKYIVDAMEGQNAELVDLLRGIYVMLTMHLPELAQRQVVLNTGETVGALAVPMNEALGKIAKKKERG